MSDKPVIQQELADSLAKSVLDINGDAQWLFIRCFWETMSREWMGLDRHRLGQALPVDASHFLLLFVVSLFARLG